MIEERVRGEEEEEKDKEVSGLDKARLSQLPQRIPQRRLHKSQQESSCSASCT
jgi:hypothetical protein